MEEQNLRNASKTEDNFSAPKVITLVFHDSLSINKHFDMTS